MKLLKYCCCYVFWEAYYFLYKKKKKYQHSHSAADLWAQNHCLVSFFSPRGVSVKHILFFLDGEKETSLGTATSDGPIVRPLADIWSNMEHWCNGRWKAKTEALGQKTVPVSRCPPPLRDGIVGWVTSLQSGRSRVRFAMGVFEIFHWLNLFGRTMVLGSTQPLMSNRNISWG
jgi:hypothetical protein